MSFISTKEASEIIGVNTRRVLTFIHDGRLKAIRHGARAWLINKASAEKLASEERPGGEAGKKAKREYLERQSPRRRRKKKAETA